LPPVLGGCPLVRASAHPFAVPPTFYVRPLRGSPIVFPSGLLCAPSVICSGTPSTGSLFVRSGTRFHSAPPHAASSSGRGLGVYWHLQPLAPPCRHGTALARFVRGRHFVLPDSRSLRLFSPVLNALLCRLTTLSSGFPPWRASHGQPLLLIGCIAFASFAPPILYRLSP